MRVAVSRTPQELQAFVLADPLCRRLAALADELDRPLALVGGCVRDWFLGRPALDWDFVVPGDPTPLVQALTAALGGPLVTLDATFGVVRTRLPSGLTIDVVRQQGDSLSADLSRRDLTINALACPLADGVLVDPLGGLSDLAAGSIRVPDRRNLVDDPLRLVRVFRFCATLGFTPVAATLAWATELAPEIHRSAGERVWAEIAKILACSDPTEALHGMRRSGLLAAIFPEANPTDGALVASVAAVAAVATFMEWVGEQEGDVGTWLWAWLGQPASGERSRWAMLAGGALLRQMIPATAPASGLVSRVGARLHWSKREQAWLMPLSCQREAASALWAAVASADDGQARRGLHRLFAAHGEVAIGLILLAAPPAPESASGGARVLGLISDMWRRLERPLPRLVDGNALMEELGLKPGPHLADLLAGIAEAQAMGEVKTRAEALAWAAEVLLRG